MPADYYHDPATSVSNPRPVDPKPGMVLYKAATLLVILLFLLSFWSC